MFLHDVLEIVPESLLCLSSHVPWSEKKRNGAKQLPGFRRAATCGEE